MRMGLQRDENVLKHFIARLPPWPSLPDSIGVISWVLDLEIFLRFQPFVARIQEPARSTQITVETTGRRIDPRAFAKREGTADYLRPRLIRPLWPEKPRLCG